MDTSDEAPVEALLRLTEYFPVGWSWDAVPGQRIRVRNGRPDASEPVSSMLLSVEDSTYRAEVQPGQLGVSLAPVDQPTDAVDALERMFVVTTLAAVSTVADPGDAA